MALAGCDELAERRPDDADLQADRAVVYMQLGRVKMETYEIPAAIPFFEKALLKILQALSSFFYYIFDNTVWFVYNLGAMYLFNNITK